ncbi:MAG: hypothetical protein OEZ43_20445 [Gammaproteobacteria bacterium]|nr:hypothetical protein [Gammaproteobacteria bacterium]
MIKENGIFVFILVVLLGASSPSVFASNDIYYVFKDSRGKTLIQDQIPPEMKHKGYKIVNANGVTLEVVPPQPKSQPDFAENELQPDDVRLLQSYASVHDIESARDNNLMQLSEIINSTENNIRAFEHNLEFMQQRKRRLLAAGLPVDEKLIKDIVLVKELIVKNREYMERKRSEHTQLSTSYQKDIARFKVIQKQSRQR